MAYQLEGSMLEVCTCKTICPCFVNQSPDGDSCDVTVAWHFDKGQIEGVDVAGRTFAVIAHLPGKPMDGGWRAAVYLDDGTTDAQQDALVKVFTGQLGGAIADVAKLVGQVVSVERAPIAFNTGKGKASLKIGSVADAETQLFLGANGEPSILANTIVPARRERPRCWAARLATGRNTRVLASTSISPATAPSRQGSASTVDAAAQETWDAVEIL